MSEAWRRSPEVKKMCDDTIWSPVAIDRNGQARNGKDSGTGGEKAGAGFSLKSGPNF
jgi:hypothetical protein